MAQAVAKDNLVVAAVLSGNRNFEGRVNPLVQGQLPGFAAAGGGLRARGPRRYRPARTSRSARTRDGQAGLPARHLADRRRGQAALNAPCTPRCSSKQYADGLRWATSSGRRSPVPAGDLYEWDDESTYIKKPPYFERMADPIAAAGRLRRCACWPCWATPSPRTTSHRQARSPSTARPAGT